ncbi:MAG: twin-arginine translocation signal domain-containing protein, partial [Tunicatimonas sp.]
MNKSLKNLLAVPAASSTNPRRDFLQKASLSGLALGGLSLSRFANKPIEETLEYATQRVNRSSNPSDL